MFRAGKNSGRFGTGTTRNSNKNFSALKRASSSGLTDLSSAFKSCFRAIRSRAAANDFLNSTRASWIYARGLNSAKENSI